MPSNPPFKSVTAVNTKRYQKLSNLIGKELSRGRKAVTSAWAKTLWNVGRHINRDLLKYAKHAGYGEHLYEFLAKHHPLSADTLRRVAQFQREYPIWARAPKLSFRHLRDLLRINDPLERQKLIIKVIHEKLTSPELRDIIKKKNTEKIILPTTSGNFSVLKMTRGLLYTYKIIRVPEPIQESGLSLIVDCGFHEIYPLSQTQINTFKDGQLVESKVKGRGYQIKKSLRAQSDLYTYKAYLQRVIDGDTIWVFLDVGFGKRWTHQKLRFRGIDVYEIDTELGKKAKKFIEDLLRQCSFIIIKTYLDDKYARPLADIFYIKGETDPHKVTAQGKYLNQELLDLGFAREWKI